VLTLYNKHTTRLSQSARRGGSRILPRLTLSRTWLAELSGAYFGAAGRRPVEDSMSNFTFDKLTSDFLKLRRHLKSHFPIFNRSGKNQLHFVMFISAPSI
jgi:hypothetical protein